MASKTINFLPTIFRTDTNEKFLSATLDQLISEPDLKKIYGYIGRTFAPTYKSTDSYIQENTTERQQYQLEPSVVIKNTSNEVTFFSSYIDLLNKIKFYGGKIDNHDRLFNNEYYSFDPLIDYDKFVNFSQYYWLENGPDAVSVYTGSAEYEKTYIVTRNAQTNSYEFSSNGISNPTFNLARGGTYKFEVNQPGYNFWLQVEPGVDGALNRAPTINSRDVLGVENNGIDVGTITFTVPQLLAQERFVTMPTVYNVDFTTSATYSDIHANLVSTFFGKYEGFDGMVSQLNGKTLVFVDQDKVTNPLTYTIENPYIYEQAWTVKGPYELDTWDEFPWDNLPTIWDRSQFARGATVPESDRVSVWQIKLIPVTNTLTLSGPITATAGSRIVQNLTGASATVIESVVNSATVSIQYDNDQIFETGTGVIQINSINQSVYPISTPENDYIIHLDNRNIDGTIRRINFEEKVYIKSGKTNANKYFYKEYDELLKVVPLISSDLDTIYYQDSSSTQMYGDLKIVDSVNWSIDVINDILGKKKYTSPNGVVFTNGLKIQFDVNVTPESYKNKEYYVEGVGSAITLTPVDLLVTPEPYHNELSIIYETTNLIEYITINRGSQDLNPWSRNNRWFHKEVIDATASYNKTIALYDQKLRAVRPIIEFEPNIRLFNNGKIAKKHVDIIDLSTTDAFNFIQGQNIEYSYGVELTDGMRIIFANDNNPLVRNKIYTINFIQPATDVHGNPTGLVQINLTKADDGDVEEYDTVTVVNSTLIGTYWWYNGTTWIQSQQKTVLNQPPLFDVFENQISFSNSERSSFEGTQIFGYKTSTAGVNDSVLGFPLSYRNFGTQGEIEFQNYFDTDTFNYFDNGALTSKSINLGVLEKVTDRYTSTYRNIWNTVSETSKQYQLISYEYDGTTNIFELPVAPSDNESSIPYIKIYKNSKFLKKSLWSRNGLDITISDSMTIGDIIDVLIYTNSVINVDSYQVPLNLDYNAQNLDFSSLTLGQIRNHVVELFQNSNDATGDSIGMNNLRDLVFKQQGGNILQHSSPVPYSSIFLCNETSNFVDSIKLAQHEYSKFKNKFLELSVTLQGIDTSNPATGVDLILKSINGFKNISFPWYYSDMVPNGDVKNVISTTVYDPLVKSYEISNIFNDTELSNKSVLVYLNSDPSAVYIEGTGIDVTSDILNKTAYVTPTGVVFENGLKIRFGNSVTPVQYRNSSYVVQGVGTGIALVGINNNVQLVKGKDYIFDQNRPSITITENVTLDVDYKITIVEYSNTDGNYIPETPSKLGLYPKYIPEIIEDDTYRSTINVIIGHDGSKTPAFGDYRDDFLLELERRIYNNIKVSYDQNSYDIYDAIPGKFRNSEYTLLEFDSILSTNFLTWVGNNKLDYSTNTTFQSNDGFTWNYALFSDRIDGEKLQGSWKAIYRYMYDTETPHRTPWEMLGFSEKPDWWEGYYGPAPYTGGNELLWSHLEEGRIVEGTRSGIDTRFARPGLTSVIPVNSNGFLRSPVEFLTASFNSKNAATAWAVGNQGPVESAWRRSSEFPFAVQLALALTKPARYFGSLIDTKNYSYNDSLNQYLILANNHHIKQSDIFVNGDTINGLTYRSSGYINWIADYLKNQGMNPYTTINELLSQYQINLAYKIAGFTDKKYLRILAEQYSPTSTNDSIVIPDENYIIPLNKSTPVQKIIYSAVIIEKTDNGYTVRGYDLSNPYFTIIPSIVSSHSTRITVLNETATIFFDYQNLKITVPYGYEFKSYQQVVDFLISYERYLMAQGFTFVEVEENLGEVKNWQLSCREFLFWVQQGWATGSVLVLSPVNNKLNVVTSGSIVDAISDNTYGSKVVDQNFRMIRNIEYKVLRSPTDFSVTITNNEVIGLVELSLVQYEHVLVFDNITIFNDVIYKPELGNRQFRLKIIGQKTANWDGSLSPSGFIYNSGKIQDWYPGKDYLKGDLVKFKENYYVSLENIIATDTFNFSKWKQIDYSKMKKGLLPNFSFNAGQADTYYNNYSELVDTNNKSYQGKKDSNRSHYGYGLIGFKPRQYLNDLGLTDSTQLEFYKGIVKEKGTVNAVDGLLKTKFNSVTGQIDFYEDWAVRVGEYGALTTNPWLETVIDEKTFSTNSQVLEFVGVDEQNRSNGYSVISSVDLYKSSKQYDGTIASNRNTNTSTESDILSAGFVNINDVDATIFDISNVANLESIIGDVGTGYTIWCAKDFYQDWNVYRVTETNNFVTSISNSLDGFISITTNDFHNLAVNDTFLIKNFNSSFDGFYQVYSIVNLNTIIVKYSKSLANFTTVSGNGLFFRLDSLKFDYMENVRIYNPLNGWRVGEKVWIKHVTPNNEWGVFEKKEPWTLKSLVDKTSSEYQSNDGFGHSLKMNDSATVFAVGSPNNTMFGTVGVVDLFVKVADSEFKQGSSVYSAASTTVNFGYSLDLTETILAIGAPNSGTNRGYVFVYKADRYTAEFQLLQIIRGSSSDNLGSTVALSRDELWMYIGAPGTNKVYAYAMNTKIPHRRSTVTIGPSVGSNTITLSWAPYNQNSILITGYGLSYIPGLDFTVSGKNVTFTSMPLTDVDVVISQNSCFELVDTLVGSAGENFGSAISVSSDGAQLAVGAPTANVTVNGTVLTGAGSVYVYDRSVESFKSTGSSVYTTTNNIQPVYRVTVDGIETTEYSTTVGSNTVTFSTIPELGSIVTIETNKFNLLQVLTGSDPQINARFGTSLTICSFNCAIYVGAPGLDVLTGSQNKPANQTVIPAINKGTIVNSGAVFKNHNQGRLYGTIAGTKINPVVTVSNSIRINEFEVVFTGTTLASVVSDINNKDIIGVTAFIEAHIVEGKYYKDNSTGTWYDSNSVQVTDILVLDVLSTTSNSEYKFSEMYYHKINGVWVDDKNTEIADTTMIALLDSQTYLRLTSQSTLSRNKLRVLIGTGTAIADLGLDVFVQMQIITSPNNIVGEQFGTKVTLNSAAHSLVISSTSGSTIVTTTFDSATTFFDDASTRYKEPINSSGAAYLFELYDDPRDSVELPGRYAYTQQFIPTGLNLGDQFGWSTEIVGNYVIITAPNDSTTTTSGGSVYLFKNSTGYSGWEQIAAQQAKVDINSISRLYLYDRVKNLILTNLETIDPIKGKILGQAEQEITYKTSIDPAVYNRGTKTSVTISENNYWNSKQHYQVWWNLDKVRYIDYEQTDLTYRSLNWGDLFPGSVIEVCEWTESNHLPSNYVSNNGDGVPLYEDDSAYVEVISVDPTIGTITVKYYYWVKNKSTLTAINSYRTLTTTAIADLIENPSIQNIPYAAVIKDNAIIFYNITSYLSGNDTILHIDYGNIDNKNIIHSEYELIQNNPDKIVTIPTKIVNRLIDSLSGINSAGATVPDPKLKESERYGISVRPRQTMFVNRLSALEQSVSYINSVLKQFRLSSITQESVLNSEEPIPSVNSGEWNQSVLLYEDLYYLDTTGYPTGYRILVETDSTQDGLWVIYSKNASLDWEVYRVQSYKTSQYWQHIDWYELGYDSTVEIDYIVQTTNDALQSSYAVGDIVKISNNGSGKWMIVKFIEAYDLDYDGVHEYEIIAEQDGTIQIDTAVYSASRLGFDDQGFSSARFDQDPSIELRYMLKVLLQDNISSEFKSLLNDVFFVLVNFMYTEQQSLDWIFKTSFVTVFHQLRSLAQTPNYINDNQTFYEDYINEIKPYKTKIREYILDYTGEDTFNGSVTDFDLPPYYDADTKTFRSPSGEIQLKDEQTWQSDLYKDWYNNRTYEIGEIIVTNPGSGYTLEPAVEIICSTGSGASAHAVIDFDTGTVTDIIVDNNGTGYESQVTVRINGNGTGAAAYPLFKQNQPRGIATTIKFDRISYKSTVLNWSANTIYNQGDIISYNGQAYQVNSTYVSDLTLDYSKVSVYNANLFVNSNDRIVGYYNPSIDMPVVEVESENFITANVTTNSNLIYIRSVNTDGNSNDNYVDTVRNLKPGMIITGNGANAAIITNVVANVQAKVNYITVNKNQTLDANIQLTASFNNLGQIVSGVDYPGVQVMGPIFDESPGFDMGQSFGTAFDPLEYDADGTPMLSGMLIDTNIQSSYTDLALGTRPEDIIVDGGSFVDKYSSHAPEEFIPGIIYDTLDMKVFTIVNGNVLGYRVFNNMNNTISYLRLSSAYETELLYDLNITDTEIHVTDSSVLPSPSKALAVPGVVFIGGERITYYRNYANEVIEWNANVLYQTDTIVSYGNVITFDTNITVNKGDYIIQPSSGANVIVTASVVNQQSVSVYYLNTNTFVSTTGNVQTVNNQDNGNVSNVMIHSLTSEVGYYKTTGQTQTSEFVYSLVEPLQYNNINVLSQLRRGTSGTSVPEVHVAGELVIDSSVQQLIPNTTVTASSLTSTQLLNLGKIAEKPSYILELDGTISANVGDVITQSFISGANVSVLNNVINSNIVFVTYNSTSEFVYGNIVLAGYGLSINGTTVDGVYPKSMTLSGYQINENGYTTQFANVTSNVSLITDKIWSKIGNGITNVTDGSGLGSGTISTWTEQEEFLWASPYR